MIDPLSFQQECAKAWRLWQALHQYAAILWQRYEQPFIDFIEEQRRNSISVTSDPLEDHDEDIPF